MSYVGLKNNLNSTITIGGGGVTPAPVTIYDYKFKVHQSATQLVVGTTITTLTENWVKDYDALEGFDTSTGIWTCPADGVYLFTAHATFTSTANLQLTTLYVSSGGVDLSRMTAISAIGKVDYLSCEGMGQLTAGAEVIVTMRVGSTNKAVQCLGFSAFKIVDTYAFNAIAAYNPAVTISTNTDTLMSIASTERYDNGGGFDSTNSSWTCPASGIYRLYLLMVFHALQSGRYMYIRFVLNGTTEISRATRGETTQGGGNYYVPMAVNYEFTAGDVITVYVFASRNVVANQIISFDQFSGYKLP